MDINLTADNIEVSNRVGRISVDLFKVDIEEIIDAIGRDKILEKIGKDAAVEHFNIIEIE